MSSGTCRIWLAKGRESSVRRFHPWVFSGAVHRIEGSPAEGDLVEVVSSEGAFLGYGHYQKGSIAVRILDFCGHSGICGDRRMPQEFWDGRIASALNLRRSLGLPSQATDSYRLVHGEGDSLPGLVIDYYAGVAVVQAHSAGMFLSLDRITESLKHCYGNELKAVYDKSSATAPHKAGLSLCDRYLYGNPDDNPHIIRENGNLFEVDWESGQKTGFFIDQRDNRALVAACAPGRTLLNLFCYTGGFSVYALAAGAAAVVSVDSSQKAADMTERNIALNFPGGSPHEAVCADAIDYLKNVEFGKYDMMIVDPPAFAKHRDALDNALRAYRRLNASALSKVARGGIVFTFSCSQVVDRQMFYTAVFSAAVQSGRNVRVLGRLGQPADHPVNIYHPEGEYLKGLALYVE